MFRIRVSIWFVCTILIACSSSQRVIADEPINILFIGVDDLRPDLNCYGASHMKTPNFDRLAAEGVLFNRAYCQQAVCLPSRISLLTGMHPDSTGVQDLNTHFRDTIPDVVTLPQQLRKSGYHTIGMGKVYHDEQPKEWDEWIDVAAETGVSKYHLPETLANLKKLEAQAKAEGLKGKQKRRLIKGPAFEAADLPDEAYEDGAMTKLAIDRIKSSKGKPFFITVGYHKPHLPFVAPKKYWDMHDRKSLSLPENYVLPKGAPQLALSSWGELRAYADIPKQGPVTDEQALELIHGYCACISFIDAQIGQLLDTLRDEGLKKNTVVVLWSDHGWKLGEHAMWCKHTNFEIDARVPLIVRLPGGVHGGRSSDAMVELVDLYPTLCEFAGAAIPEQCEGASLVPLLHETETPNWRRAALSQFKRRRNTGGDIVGYSIKVPKGRYTEWINLESGKTKAVEYYDHDDDPNENQNAHEALSETEKQSLSKMLRESIERPSTVPAN